MTFPTSAHLVEGTGTQVGLLTLWTKKEQVLSHVDPSLYCVASQLYSRDEGLSLLLRSLFQHKHIRDIVVTGVDLNQCGETLLALWNGGVQNGMINGSSGYVDIEIPSDAIDRLREAVTLHDLRAERDYGKVADYIRAIPQKDSWGDSEVFPETTIVCPDQFPTSPQHTLRENDIHRVCIHLAKLCARFHTVRNVHMLLTAPGKETHSGEDIESHVADWFDRADVQGMLVRDRLTQITSQVSDQGHASLTFYAQDRPMTMTFHLDGGLHISCMIDSYDISGLSLLLASLYYVLDTVAAEIHQASKTVSLFVADITWELSEKLQRMQETPLPIKKIGDPRGNLLFRLVNGEIEVTHLSPDGKRMERFTGTSAKDLYMQLVRESRISDLSHAAYAGYELARAELALKQGTLYEQDRQL